MIVHANKQLEMKHFSTFIFRFDMKCLMISHSVFLTYISRVD